MATAEIEAGICGFKTVVDAKMDGQGCVLTIRSDCKSIQRLARRLTRVNPFDEISFSQSVPQTLQMGKLHCPHAACPVPVGIIKAIEIAAGLALPADVAIRLSR
ncbi:DUF6951 family protein [Desulfosarcina ovata]|uniref:Uncharacterized protein n=2 Tax=Desulfosarcina ovata TaxID=83564 RepID=A0A5K8A8J7_9BACT|nr:hypothetical protein [Desulfosarcina ovata]BBO81408.1 hypothetical protein DSCO28_19740 [Desulfosarcina ovata subsp. sediminis]BBO88664.1 hypothetical protein DSCOOX_18440 [Desulfosarcina ovata subsp. ovata]